MTKTLVQQLLTSIPFMHNDSADLAVEDQFYEALEALLVSDNQTCQNIVEEVTARLNFDQQNWFIDELEGGSELHVVETRDKEYAGVLFAIPLMFSTEDSFLIPRKLTDPQRWSVENLLKINGVFNDLTKFCRVCSTLYHPDELFSLSYSSVYKITRSLCEQAADFEDRVEPPIDVIEPFIPPQSEGPVHCRVILGTAMIPAEYIDDLFSQEELEDVPSFVAELKRVFNFDESNIAITGVSIPNGYYIDLERMSTLNRESCFKGFLDHVVSTLREGEEFLIEVSPVEFHNFKFEVFSSFDNTLVAYGIWETFTGEFVEESLDQLLECAKPFFDKIKLSDTTKDAIKAKSLILQ